MDQMRSFAALRMTHEGREVEVPSETDGLKAAAAKATSGVAATACGPPKN
jgi:hypothetical protein